MNLSKKWLDEFVTVDNSVSEKDFCEALTMSGSKVEGYEIEGSELSNIVVGKITAIEKHPDADKLQVCAVDIGKENLLQIVTAATNISVGDLVPVALDNSVVHGGQKIRKGKLRGVLSEGMFCSVAELGVTVNDYPYAIEDGIMILQEDGISLGQDIREAIGLNDTVYEFEITSNRPDCLSIIGLARETAVTFGKKLRLHTPEVKDGDGNIADLLSVDIKNNELCKRYAAKIVKNVRVKPSPRYIRERLRACGVRPINNIVDITNYVMLEYGQPMHAFDLRFVKGGEINVRLAENGEKITTLDGVDRELKDDMLVIADAEKPIAVAGVMGGEYSGIMDDTNTIVFESACFDGASVRTTARDLGMRTDASARYEKGLDPNTCMDALMRACELVQLLDAGDVVGGVIDCYANKNERLKIGFDADWINRFLGTDISRDRMVDILKTLDFAVDGDFIYPPTYRGDVLHKADVAEEIARIYGYNNIPVTEIRGSAQGGLNKRQKFENKLKGLLTSIGYNQILTYSYTSPKVYEKAALDSEKELARSVVIRNPLGEDSSIMRTTALPSMLETVARNYNNRNASAKLFEIATEYIKTSDDTLPIEQQKIEIAEYSQTGDFYSIKRAVETILHELSIKDYDIVSVHNNATYHPGRCAEYRIGDKVLCRIGQIHPTVAANFGIGTSVYTATIDLELLRENANDDKHYTPLPKFPAVERDLALLCDMDTEILSLQREIARSSKLIKEVKFFDIYIGEQIPDGKKSIAFNIVMQSAERTLTDEDCDNAMNKIIKNLKALGAELRV